MRPDYPRTEGEGMNNNEDIKEDQAELLEIIVKAARRCAYDLEHAADQIIDRKQSDMYHERAKMWQVIFNPANGPKDYRNSLHKEIWVKDMHIRKLKELCKKHNIPEFECESITDWSIDI